VAILGLLWHQAPHVGLGGEHVGDLGEEGGAHQQAKSVRLEDPALVNVVLEGECLDHGSNGVGVDHSAAHDCRRVDPLL